MITMFFPKVHIMTTQQTSSPNSGHISTCVCVCVCVILIFVIKPWLAESVQKVMLPSNCDCNMQRRGGTWVSQGNVHLLVWERETKSECFHVTHAEAKLKNEGNRKNTQKASASVISSFMQEHQKYIHHLDSTWGGCDTSWWFYRSLGPVLTISNITGHAWQYWNDEMLQLGHNLFGSVWCCDQLCFFSHVAKLSYIPSVNHRYQHTWTVTRPTVPVVNNEKLKTFITFLNIHFLILSQLFLKSSNLTVPC